MIPDDFKKFLRTTGMPKDSYLAFDDFKAKTEPQQKVIELCDSIFKQEYRVLLLSGKQGAGKTYGVCASLGKHLKERYLAGGSLQDYAEYITHYELEMYDKACMNPRATRTQIDVYNHFTNIPILIIEEIGRGNITNYTMNYIENIISKRYANKKTTILITNKTARELKDMFDASILDRIANGVEGKAFDVAGESLR